MSWNTRTATWRSSTENLELAGGVRNLLNQIFSGVERGYGDVLTKSAFGFVTETKGGVSDSEMCDLLTLHPGGMEAVNQYNSSPTIPPHVWLRVRGEIEGLLTEREGGCLVWYHRQLREAAEERYKKDKALLHRTMALYFGDLSDRTKGVAQQPMTASQAGASVPVWLPTAQVNKRRCVEAGAHMLGAGMFVEMVSELCSLESVCARAKTGELFTMLQQLIDLKKQAACKPEGSRSRAEAAQTLRLAHYIRWLQRDIHKLAHHAGRSDVVFVLSAAQPKISTVYQDCYDCYRQQVPTSRFGDSSAWLRCRILGGRSDFEPVINILEGSSSWQSFPPILPPNP